jgi:hypothetical protein
MWAISHISRDAVNPDEKIHAGVVVVPPDKSYSQLDLCVGKGFNPFR